MYLIHIGKFYPPYHGGMETYLSDLCLEQTKQGHKVTVVVHNHDWGMLYAKTATTQQQGIKLIKLKSLRPILHTPLMIGLNKKLNQLIATQKPDLIHLHWPNPSLFSLLFNKHAKAIPWVISWHSDMVTENSSWLLKLVYRLIKPLENRLINRAQSLLVSSQNYADHSPQLHNNKHKVKVIPLGINTQSLAQWQPNKNETNGWQDGVFRLFSLGRLTFYKNQKMLIHAMKQLPDCQLLLAGNGQLKQSLTQQVETLKLTDHVNLLGAISWQKVHQLFSSCDVFCLVSHDRAESFGVVLLEAMYHNKIILVADTAGSGMKWLAENYQKGFTFKAGDVNDFVRQLRKIQLNFTSIMQTSHQFDYDIEPVTRLIDAHYQDIKNHSINN